MDLVVSRHAQASAAVTVRTSNWALMVRLFGLAWRYRLHCLRVLGIQLVLLTLGLMGLNFTGVGIDYIRRRIAERSPLPGGRPLGGGEPPCSTLPFPKAGPR